MTDNYIESHIIMVPDFAWTAMANATRSGDPIKLYGLYYNTAKRQNTNQPKCTTSFAARACNWSERRVRRTKKILIGLNLIEDVVTIHPKTRKITGHYIKVKYIFTKKNENRVNELMGLNADSSYPKTTLNSSHPEQVVQTNALNNNNLNALSKVKKKEKTMLKTYKAKKRNKKYRHMFGSFDDIISYYSDGNWALKLKMKDFVQMRHAIGRKLSYPGLVGIFDRLNELSGENYFAKIDMLDKSIRNSWADVYELNQEEWEEAWRRFRHNDPQKYELVTGQHYETTELDYCSG